MTKIKVRRLVWAKTASCNDDDPVYKNEQDVDIISFSPLAFEHGIFKWFDERLSIARACTLFYISVFADVTVMYYREDDEYENSN